MSLTVGRIRVDAATPQAPLHNLLSVPGVLLEGGRWEGGVNVWGYVDALPLTWDACTSGTFRDKDDGSENTRPTESFDSFAIYIAEQCTTISVAGDLQGFAARTRAVLEASQSFAVEQALAQGVDGTSNKYLGDGDLVSLAQNVSAKVGLSWLENAIGATGRRGMIHITPAVAIAAGVALDSLDDPRTVLFTPSGNVIVIGAGYIGTDPDDETSPSSGKDWIFATGPVQVRLSDVLSGPEELPGLVDHELNDVVYRAEKLANVSWDGSLQVGVLVDWTL